MKLVAVRVGRLDSAGGHVNVGRCLTSITCNDGGRVDASMAGFSTRCVLVIIINVYSSLITKTHRSVQPMLMTCRSKTGQTQRTHALSLGPVILTSDVIGLAWPESPRLGLALLVLGLVNRRARARGSGLGQARAGLGPELWPASATTVFCTLVNYV